MLHILIQIDQGGNAHRWWAGGSLARFGMAMVFVALMGNIAHAQDEGKYPFEEYDRRIAAARGISALDSGAFGENVSGFDGGRPLK
ncbi:hypothetical protein LDO32_17430 [Luteimonas sp. Y-2-2-4F]|nr:hypothetical protein [Luteimonas sp. Y-2-2-4F]MCD9033497.1 hypothetical protein [Luteimonas sp. Y-2-2-4F]